MRKFLTTLAAVAALLCTSSCNLSSLQDYNFSYEIIYQLSSEEQQEAIVAYFQDFIDAHTNFVCRGEYTEALGMGIEQFSKDIQSIDAEYLGTILKTEQDLVRLVLTMTGDKTNVLAAYETWAGTGEAEE
ncbi:MAG: hypothetical protein K5849_05015 [Bacteroidales bacterium]|nr:hypothetical protein [Bacteroidales bacterium]